MRGEGALNEERKYNRIYLDMYPYSLRVDNRIHSWNICR